MITLDRSAVAYWEAGQAMPNVRIRRFVIAALDVDYDAVFADPPQGAAA